MRSSRGSGSSGSRQPSDKQGGGKRSILNNAAYSIFTQSSTSESTTTRNVAGNAGSRRVNHPGGSNLGGPSFLQRSVSADNVVVRQRGFKPSDRHDPAKRNFLESLTSKILHFDMESGNSTPINLQKLLTPASDSNEMMHVKNKKMYASSYFYAPTHPTVEDQVELARRISNSLSDVKNVKSKGQSMYVNRKKRSVKWIHDGNGAEEVEEPSAPARKDKVPLKCMMNPSGKVLDIHGIQEALGEEVNISTTPPPHPERLFDIVRDLNNQKGRGAEIFAKRRKRSEKWVVDTEQPQSPSGYGYKAPLYPMKQDIVVNENTKYDSNKPFYNPFTADISMDYSTPPTSCARQCSRGSFSSAHSDCGPCHTEVKKIYLREVAVGTEPELGPPKILEKPSRRAINADGPRYHHHHGNHHHQHHHHHHQRNSCNSSVSNGYSRGSKGAKSAHHYQPNGYQYQSRANGYHSHHVNGFSYLNNQGNGYHQPSYHSNGYHNGNGYQNGSGYPNGNGYQSNNNGYHQQPQSNDMEEVPEEDYTPVPVKQLIQEFEKTCRPVMQYKQYAPQAAPVSHSQNDISRFFESRREVVYHKQSRGNQQYRSSGNGNNNHNNNNGYASSGDDEEEDEEEEEEDDDEDDDASLDDSLSPVDLYRIDDRRLLATSGTAAGNRSSSMSTLDEYYRRQYRVLEQLDDERSGGKKYLDPEAELPPAVRAANLAAVAQQDEIIKQKKHLRNTPVLENLVAGTTTPECFKKEFTEEVAGKLYDNAYSGPKISSYQNLTNYNTAPRGWDQSQAVYRPVRFEKLQDNKIVYSDF